MCTTSWYRRLWLVWNSLSPGIWVGNLSLDMWRDRALPVTQNSKNSWNLEKSSKRSQEASFAQTVRSSSLPDRGTARHATSALIGTRRTVCGLTTVLDEETATITWSLSSMSGSTCSFSAGFQCQRLGSHTVTLSMFIMRPPAIIRLFVLAATTWRCTTSWLWVTW